MNEEKWMDKLGFIKESDGIKGFSLIEKSSDIPLIFLDVIKSLVREVKENGSRFVPIELIASILADTKIDAKVMDDFCNSIRDKYSNNCIYLNHSFSEWVITDLFSSVVCCFFITTYIQQMIRNKEKKPIKISGFIFDNNYSAITNISTEESRISFRGIQKDLVEDLKVDNIKFLGLAATDASGLSGTFDTVLLIADMENNTYEITLPLVGYKCLIEQKLSEDSKVDNEILSISIYDMSLSAMLIE